MPTEILHDIPDAADIHLAHARIRAQIRQTPVINDPGLDEELGCRLFCKCENLQRTGAFKFRGAFNSMSRLTEAEKAQGVITFSSGNHAQAVALVGQMLNIQTTIVMPNNAPETKRAATEDYGATIVEYDPKDTTREALAESLQAKKDFTMIPPFDHTG